MARRKRQPCAGEGGLVDPDELEVVEGILLHEVHGQYHRVSNGMPVRVENGKIIDEISRPIDPGTSIQY